jgi:twitching motility protein PilT
MISDLVGDSSTSQAMGGETTKLALRIACSQVLVLAAMQTSTASATIDAIVHAVPPPEQPHVRSMLAESLAGIVAQQLLRSKDGQRTAAFEVLVTSPAVSTIIQQGGRISPAACAQTLDGALEKLMTQGKIAPELALEVAADKEAFARLVARVRPELVEGT